MNNWQKEFNKQFGGIYILEREPKKIFEQLQAFISQVEADAENRVAIELGKLEKAETTVWYDELQDKGTQFLAGVTQGWNNARDEINNRIKKYLHEKLG